MGTFLSDHPLSQVREALRVRSDCTLAELEKRPDGTTVTVGGIVSEAKRIRTKSGSTMMFATLDDLEGRVEMIIFAKTLDANEGLIDTDAVLLVRGRVDRKDRGEVKLVVHEAQPFEPTSDEVETAREKVRELDKPVCFALQLDAADFDPSIIEELKSVFGKLSRRCRSPPRDEDPRRRPQAPLRQRLSGRCPRSVSEPRSRTSSARPPIAA